PLRRALTFRLLALRLGSFGRGWASGDGSLRRSLARGGGGGGGGRFVPARRGPRPRGPGRPGRARGPGRRRTAGRGQPAPPGGGGGCRCTTTSRVVTAAGGRRTSTIAGCPRTLWRSGTIRAVLPTTGACSSRSRGTTITLRFTGRDRTNVSCDTTVTPSGAPRLR